MTLNNFTGFTKETIKFFKDLEMNNDKVWFDDNRKVYIDHVMQPASSFVVAMGKKLKSISPKIVADPRRDKSIFRINRDTRFSNNKAQYKTHLGIYFWEGKNKKLENPGFYFQFDSKELIVAAGKHQFPKQHLKDYRDSVVDEKYGKQLKQIIKKIASRNKNYELGWESYKKVPRGYDKEHPNADLLLYEGIGFLYKTKIPKEFFSDKLINYCLKIFKDMSPIHYWLVDMIKRSKN